MSEPWGPQQPYETPQSAPEPQPPRRRNRRGAWIAGIVVIGAAIGIPVAASSGSDDSGPERVEVTRSIYESLDRDWPLTVDTAAVGCDQGAAVVVVDGTTYALNGMAQADHPALDPVWRPDPAADGLRVNVSDLLGEALNLCGDPRS